MDDRSVRTEAIEGFAQVLRELRASVGNPPFREMSGRSGAISHTTLHEAAKGNRLPSWETTVEFAKACGADPAAYRERWENASLAVRSAGARARTPADAPALVPATVPHPASAPAAPLSAPVPVPGSAPASAPAEPVPAPPAPASVSASSVSASSVPAPAPEPAAASLDVAPARRRSPMSRPAIAAIAVVGSVAAVVLAAVERDQGAAPAPARPTAAALTPDDCPVRQTDPPQAPPLHAGDIARFISDITLPDCTRVGPGQTLTKVWRLKNDGTVPWQGYRLRRLDVPQRADQCQTIADVPIEDTRPGAMVDISTVVTTPRRPGVCFARFKMTDASGRLLFPGSRPVTFQLVVE
ncbi:hypothetical protein GCM10022221_19960 [Actinocorallia aurea]